MPFDRHHATQPISRPLSRPNSITIAHFSEPTQRCYHPRQMNAEHLRTSTSTYVNRGIRPPVALVRKVALFRASATTSGQFRGPRQTEGTTKTGTAGFLSRPFCSWPLGRINAICIRAFPAAQERHSGICIRCSNLCQSTPFLLRAFIRIWARIEPETERCLICLFN